MDFVKKAASSIGNKDQNNNQAAQGGQKDDYVDKAFGYANKKEGWGLNRDQQEKLTDGGRGAYEKMTGSQVNPKFSN